jgi:hypothetical protein
MPWLWTKFERLAAEMPETVPPVPSTNVAARVTVRPSLQ